MLEKNIIKIEDKEVGEQIYKKAKENNFSLWELRNSISKDITTITKETLDSLFNTLIKQREQEEKEQEQERIKAKAEREKEIKENEKRDKVLQHYNTTGEYNKQNIIIKDRKLTITDKGFTLELDTEMINKHIQYNYIDNNLLDSYRFEDTDLRVIIGGLVRKKVAFQITFKGKTNHFSYKGDRLLFNDIQIQKQSALKVFDWVTNSKEDIPAERIKAYSRLSGIKFKVLNDVKGIALNIQHKEVNIPITITYISDDCMGVEFLGKKKVFDWAELKGYLVSGNDLGNYFYNLTTFLQFVNQFSITKQELYEQIRLIMTLREL